jgi:RNA recognition motif-containing protein
LDYNEVWNRASDTNTTVYCGGINNFTEDLVRSTFGIYGQITGVHAFPDRGYAFIRFSTKDAACSAICGVHGLEVNGGVAKCSWGKENIDIGNAQGQSAANAMNSMSSLYSGSNMNTAAAAALGAAQSMNQLQANAANQLSSASNPWSATSAQNANWASNYQWAAAAGYPQSALNYWQSYPGYQNMMQQGWGVMPATGATGTSAAQYQMGQYPGTNGKS